MAIYDKTLLSLFYFHSSNTLYVDWSALEVLTLFEFVDRDITL